MNSQTVSPTGILEHVDPNQIVVEPNVRTSAPLTEEFVASIKQHGVLTPILARRDEQGNLLVRAGQRRTLAAREAGLPTIPAYVVQADEQTAQRIIEQIIENDQREALTDADRAAAWQQLAFEGLTPAAIAKRTGTKTARVKQGLAVVESTTANAAIVEHQIDLEQAAALIEFEDDPEATAGLIRVAKEDPARFTHAVQRAHDDRVTAQLHAAAAAELVAQGFAILDRWPSSQEQPDLANLRDLRDAEGNRPTPEQVASLEGAAALVQVYRDGATHHQYYLQDWKQHGYTRPGAPGGNSGPMTDEQKAERKTLIARNKAWDSAEVVRRNWLGELVTRKTLPTNAPVVIARGLTEYRHEVASAASHGHVLAHKILGLEEAGWGKPNRLAALVDDSPTKAVHVSLAIVLAGIEESTGRGSWREPRTSVANYLTLLETWGYTLSEVEQIAAQRGEVDEA